MYLRLMMPFPPALHTAITAHRLLTGPCQESLSLLPYTWGFYNSCLWDSPGKFTCEALAQELQPGEEGICPEARADSQFRHAEPSTPKSMSTLWSRHPLCLEAGHLLGDWCLYADGRCPEFLPALTSCLVTGLGPGQCGSEVGGTSGPSCAQQGQTTPLYSVSTNRGLMRA